MRDGASAPRATSQLRLRVQKEGVAYGTLERDSASRADSIAAAARDSADRVMQRQRDSIAALERARTDSIAAKERARQDSINALEAVRRDSVARADSIAREEQLRADQRRNRYRFNGSGWYMGVGGGTALPSGDFETLGYKSGYDLLVPIGWHSPNHLLGFRLDLGYSQFSGNSFSGLSGSNPVTLNNSDPKVLSANVNLTIRAPITPSRNVAVYAVGGGGIYNFRNFGGTSALGGFLGNDVLQSNEPSNKSTRTKFGAQFGGGFDFGAGPVSIFVESRLVNVFADRSDNVTFDSVFGANRSRSLRWVPIVLGVNIR